MMNENTNQDVKIVKTDENNQNGQTKCPKCGATDILLNINSGHLRCNYCRYEFEPEKVDGFEENIENLTGEVITSGATDIKEDVNSVITFKCSSCGAEVIIDTNEKLQARCHWCRNTLSVNEQISNGSVPDVVLPFKLKKEEAKTKIEGFVNKRKFFAHPIFKKEFTTENIMGVYLPYMIVDVNSSAVLEGQGERLVRTYIKGSGDNKKTYYDADLYSVGCKFDMTVNGLTIESSSDKLNNSSDDKTNNVINSIMPFDIENCVKWDANYLKGYSSEKRDTNIEQLKSIVNNQTKDIARHKANEVLKEYDRGIKWDTENLDVKGQQWKAAYLPVWLYSYQQTKSDGKKVLHYVAVNARTSETMGSVPIHMPKLIGISALVELLGIILCVFSSSDSENSWLLLLSGIIFFFIFYGIYRNKGARHTYERETKAELKNIGRYDKLIQRRTGLRNSRMEGANNLKISGINAQNNLIDNITNEINKKM